MKIRLFLFLLSSLLVQFGGAAESGQKNPARPFLKTEQLFPWDHLHNHGSCIVECPNEDLLVCWYRGSGERTADDVAVLGARKRKGDRQWSEPFLMADTPGYPDTNPAMSIDPQKRLWLLWCTILVQPMGVSLAQVSDRDGLPAQVRAAELGSERGAAPHAGYEFPENRERRSR